MTKLFKNIKSRLSMVKNGKSFYDTVAGRVVNHYTDCYGDEYMAFGKFGFRVKIEKNMTPKEKAEELVHKYDLFQTFLDGFSRDEAKQCTSIAVDEILDVLTKIPYGIEYLNIRDYYMEVKQEIERI